MGWAFIPLALGARGIAWPFRLQQQDSVGSRAVRGGPARDLCVTLGYSFSSRSFAITL